MMRNAHPNKERSEVFAGAELSPREVLCGDSVEFVVRLTIGEGYPSQPTRIVYDCMGMLGTSCPNVHMNEESGYVDAYVSNPDVSYTRRCWDPGSQKFSERATRTPLEGQRMIVLDLSPGLKDGDTVEMHWGETLGGFGPGTKVTTVVPRPDFRSTIAVRFFDSQEKGMPDYARSHDGYERPVPDVEMVLSYRVGPRPPHHLRLVRKCDKAMLVPHDVFWNVADVRDASELVQARGVPIRNPQGVFEYTDRNIQVKSKSLPYTETPSMEDVFEGLNLYWGDVHTHSKYSIDCFTRSGMDMEPWELMTFARDRAALDYFAVTDHHRLDRGAPYKLTRKRWENTMRDVHECDKSGKFLVFAGFEIPDPRGDAVVLFNWIPEYEEIGRDELQALQDIWTTFAGREMITIPHFHSPGQLAGGEWPWPGNHVQEPVLEILSDHGSYEREDVLESGRAQCKRFRHDRCGLYFLQHGYRYGFTANSDGHKGHVGVNGVTAAFAESLDKESIWNAYQKRHVYGTSNARIRLLFTGNGRLMGEVVPDEPEKVFLIDVVGENRLKKIDLFRNGDLYERFKPDGIVFRSEVKVREEGPSNWYVRVTQADNHIAISSPIWFE